jgi:hypothetical protein
MCGSGGIPSFPIDSKVEPASRPVPLAAAHCGRTRPLLPLTPWVGLRSPAAGNGGTHPPRTLALSAGATCPKIVAVVLHAVIHRTRATKDKPPTCFTHRSPYRYTEDMNRGAKGSPPSAKNRPSLGGSSPVRSFGWAVSRLPPFGEGQAPISTSGGNAQRRTLRRFGDTLRGVGKPNRSVQETADNE